VSHPGDGEMLDLVVDRLGDKGDAVALRPGGRRVLVRGALPGETVRVRIVRSTPSYDVGELRLVASASADRVEPACGNVALGCGGCQWQHLTPGAQRLAKKGIVEHALLAVGIDPPELTTVELEPWHYRTSIRAEVRDGRPCFFSYRSDDTVPAAGCLVAHPLLEELLTTRYDGAEHLVLRCGVRTGERMAWVQPAAARQSAPEDTRRPYFHEMAAGRRWRVSARSFFQARPDGLDHLIALVEHAAAGLDPPHRFVDLYSGVGVFAGALAEQGWSGTAVEGSTSSVRDARHNLSGLDVAVVHGDVGRYRPDPVTLAVADPSRAGLGTRGVRTVVASAAQRVVLGSCEVRSMVQDTRRLVEAGYRLTSQTLVDLFPQTFRVEVVSVFDWAPAR